MIQPYRLSLVTPPTVEPLLLSEVKKQRRIEQDDHDEDDLLWGLMRAAREHIGGKRGLTGFALATSVYDLFMDYWPLSGSTLPMPPLQSVAWVKYTDSDGVVTTVDSTIYTVKTYADSLGRLVLNYGESWPSVTFATADPVNIRFTAGFDPAGNDGIPQIPECLKQAMHLLIGHWYENREDTADPVPKYIDRGVDSLIANWTAEHVF